LEDILKVIYSSIFLIVCSLNIFAQELPNSQLNKIILTVEAFLNNEITPYKEYTIISVHEWNERYHNGYSPIHKDFSIISYPYKELNNSNETTENKIIVSISPDNDSIIVVIKYQNRYYGFYTEIINANKRKNLGNIPYEVHEMD
jgi:hypothetical protein